MADETEPAATEASAAPPSRPARGDAADTLIYPDDDRGRALAPDGSRVFVYKDGRPY
jgi:hypothetical protein